GSDFTLGFRAYDNVKVEQISVYTAYGAQLENGGYVKSDYGEPIRVVADIPAKDDVPTSTLNIDTPVFNHIVHVDRLHEIVTTLPNFIPYPGALYDVWVKFEARDR